MNMLDAIVTKVLSAPYLLYGRWWVDVEYNCYGKTSETNIMCYSAYEATNVKVGFIFQV